MKEKKFVTVISGEPSSGKTTIASIMHDVIKLDSTGIDRIAENPVSATLHRIFDMEQRGSPFVLEIQLDEIGLGIVNGLKKHGFDVVLHHVVVKDLAILQRRNPSRNFDEHYPVIDQRFRILGELIELASKVVALDNSADYHVEHPDCNQQIVRLELETRLLKDNITSKETTQP